MAHLFAQAHFKMCKNLRHVLTKLTETNFLLTSTITSSLTDTFLYSPEVKEFYIDTSFFKIFFFLLAAFH